METGTNSQPLADVVCQRGSAITTLAATALVRSAAQRGHLIPKDWLARFQDADVLAVLEWGASIQEGRPFRGDNTWDGYMTMLVTGSCIEAYYTCAAQSLKVLEKPSLYQ